MVFYTLPTERRHDSFMQHDIVLHIRTSSSLEVKVDSILDEKERISL